MTYQHRWSGWDLASPILGYPKRLDPQTTKSCTANKWCLPRYQWWSVVNTSYIIHYRCRIVCLFCLRFGIFFGFLSRYHLPCICNSLELEPVVLHGICYILAWSPCILHGICYIWPCLPSILHGICHILAFQPLICILVLQTFMWVSWGFFRLSFRVSFKVHLGFYLGLHLGFHLGFL